MLAGTALLPIILSDLNKPWEKVLHLGTPLSFAAKNVISSHCDSSVSSGAYFIRRGRVRLSNISANGQEKVLLYMGKGMLFNEIPMLINTDYLFTCMESTDTVFIPKKRINAGFVREYPELMLNLLESVSKKAQCFYSQLCGIRTYDSFINVCRVLYSMHLHNRENNKVVPQITQQEMAAFLGVHRSSLHKALSRLKDEEVIGSYSRNLLHIHNVERLQDYALNSHDD